MENKKVFVLIDSDAKYGDFDVNVYENEDKAVAEFEKSVVRIMEDSKLNRDIYGNDLKACIRNWYAYFEDGSNVELQEKTIM